MQIFVKTLSGKTIGLSVTQGNTVGDVKDKIQKKEGIPPNQQRLVVADQLPQDDKTVGDLNLSDGSVLHLVLRLGGPPSGPYPAQWIKNISVNGVVVGGRDRTDPGAAVVPTEVEPGAGTLVTVLFCTAQESGDPDADPAKHSVNVETLSDCGQGPFFDVAIVDPRQRPPPGGLGGYTPDGATGLLPIEEAEAKNGANGGGGRLVLKFDGKLDPAVTYVLYTAHLGPGYVNDDDPASAVAMRSCFRNPDSWEFRAHCIAAALA